MKTLQVSCANWRIERFEWEPSLDRAEEAFRWLVGHGYMEPYALRWVGDQVGLSVAELRVELARRAIGRTE